MSPTGLYTAPASIASQQTVTVTATTTAGTRKTGHGTVTLIPKIFVTPLSISTSAVPNGTINNPYSMKIIASGGKPPYITSVVSGLLATGLTLSSSSGMITGTPTTAGNYPFSLQVSDSANNKAVKAYTMTIAAATQPSIPTYFVSGGYGNDAWSGLLDVPNSSNTDGPFRSLSRAQSAARASSTIKAVTVRAGTYTVSSGFSFDSLDNGEVWISYATEPVIVDGEGSGVITLSGVNGITFEGLTFQNLGVNGIMFSGHSSGAVFRWNTFNGCTTSCFAGPYVQNAVIDSNILNGQGTTGGSNTASAVNFWNGSNGNRITHNLIENIEGIQFTAGSNDEPNNKNIVDRNILQNINSAATANDVGAIYMMDRTHAAIGNQITNNIISGDGGTNYLNNLSKAIYLDDEMSNVLVTGNVCSHCGEWAIQIHGGDHNTIENNIFDLSTNGTQLGLYQADTCCGPDFGMAANVFEHNIVYFSGTAPNPIWHTSLLSDQALLGVTNNLYYSASGAAIPNTGQTADLGPVYANPEFANPSAGNYSMSSSSPAYGLILFQPLATDQGPLPYNP